VLDFNNKKEVRVNNLRVKAAKRMAEKADKRMEKQREGNTPIPVGGVVTLAIPLVDRGKTDSRRLPGVVIGNEIRCLFTIFYFHIKIISFIVCWVHFC